MLTSLALPSYFSQLNLHVSPSYILVKQHMTQKSEHHRNKSAASPIIISTICTVASTKWGRGGRWRVWILFSFAFLYFFIFIFILYLFYYYYMYIIRLHSIFSIVHQISIALLMIISWQFSFKFFDYFTLNSIQSLIFLHIPLHKSFSLK